LDETGNPVKDSEGNDVKSTVFEAGLDNSKVIVGGFTVTDTSIEGGKHENSSNIGLKLNDIKDDNFEITYYTLVPPTPNEGTAFTLKPKDNNDVTQSLSTYFTSGVSPVAGFTMYEVSTSRDEKDYKYACLKITINEDIPAEVFFYMGIHNSIYADNSNLDYICATVPIEGTNEGTVATTLFDSETGEINGSYYINNRTTEVYTPSGIHNFTKVSYQDLKKGTSIYFYFVSRNITNNSTPLTDSYGNTITIESSSSNSSAFVLIPDQIVLPITALEIGHSFRVSANGKLYAKDATLGGELNVTSGGNIGGISLKNNAVSNSGFSLNNDGLILTGSNRLKFGEAGNLQLFNGSTSEDTQTTSYIRSFTPLKLQNGIKGSAIELLNETTTSIKKQCVKLT
jgi:hypothetical protein